MKLYVKESTSRHDLASGGETKLSKGVTSASVGPRDGNEHKEVGGSVTLTVEEESL